MLIKVFPKTTLKINKPLIYECDIKINIGDIVKIPIGNKETLGIVVDKIKNTSFNFQIRKIIHNDNEYIPLNISELKIIKYIIKYYNSMISNTINPYITKKIDTFKYSKDIGLLSPIKEKKIILTKEQENAIQNILNKKNKNHILLGITGSGKTHVYLEVIKHIYNQNKQSLILLPDIAITSQFYTKVKEVFPKETISIFHSKLTKKQKEIENNLINEGTRKIIIGARSALFARFNNLGIIIIDEFQDQNFKQDADPRYSTINVAKQVSLILNSKLVLVSATPLIEEYYRYKTGLYNLEKLTKRIPGSNKNIDLNLSIVDLKKEKNMIISKELSEKISESLKRKEKIILYVNRRGYSPLLICQKCKYIELCPRCEIPITVHKNYNNTYYLNCHHCEYTTTKINYLCPMCSNSVMKFYGVGTQSVKEEIQSIFLGKKLNIIILDKDINKGNNESLEIYDLLKNKDVNIIIGTQLITKAWDIYNIGLIGIILADMDYTMPDFKSTEKGFQTITQVIGRGGRENNKWNVVIQTIDIHNRILNMAVNNDFDKFYSDEIKLRKQFNLPPFSTIIKITLKGKNLLSLEKRANSVFKDLKNQRFNNTIIYNPIQGIPHKINTMYRMNIILKINNEDIGVKKFLFNKYVQSKCFTIDIDPRNLL